MKKMMYEIGSHSPFRYCGMRNDLVTGYVETYLVQRFVRLEESDYEDIRHCAECVGMLDTERWNADSFWQNFTGREEIKDLLEDLCRNGRYGFFESFVITEEEDDVIRAMYDFRKENGL